MRLTADAGLPDPAARLALVRSGGEAVLIQDDKEIAIAAGGLALADHASPIAIAGKGDWTGQSLDLGPCRLITRLQADDFPLTMAFDGGDPITLLIERIWEIGEDMIRADAGDDLIMLRLLEAIGALVEKAVAKSSDRGISDYRMKMFERAELLIAEQLSDPDLSPATLAASMRISPRHLSSLFAAAGTTSTNTILAQRLARAHVLLADPAHRHRKITDIAQACGFADASYFTRCFRRTYGCTPRALRRTKVVSPQAA